MFYAVFTGDVIGSSALGAAALSDSLAGIEAVFFNISNWSGVQRSGYSIRGGDGWQAAFDAPVLSLRAALYLRASMLALPAQSRFAVAIGDGTLPEDGDTNRGHGPVFTSSGRLLDTLPRHSQMALAGTGAQAACLLLADEIASGWTAAQGRALALMLAPEPGSRRDVAQRLGISRQAVDQALNSAGYRALTAALTAWETS